MTASIDVFLSHNWGKDEHGRDNHQRVSFIDEELKARGYKTWFDEVKMTGNIDAKMAQGIEQSEGVIIFITRRYYEKVNGDQARDSCQKEFQDASKIKIRAKMVPVVMEKFMCRATPWLWLVGINLGWEMYIDMSGDVENKTYFNQQMKLSLKELQSKGIQPMQEQTTEEEVIKKLSMELWVQILPGLGAKRYKRLKRIIDNAEDFTE